VARNDFKLYSENDEAYQLPAVQPPQPELIGQIFYSGDSREGWIPFQVAVEDPNPLLFFFGGMWFQLNAVNLTRKDTGFIAAAQHSVAVILGKA